LLLSSRTPSESSPAVSPHLSSSPRGSRPAARSSSSQLLDVGWSASDHPRHVVSAGSRSLATSPRPSTSVSADSDPVLSLPPAAGQHSNNQHLDQALEISQLQLRGKLITESVSFSIFF